MLPSNVSKWEAGRNVPQPHMFVQFAKLADGSLRTFFQQEAGVSDSPLQAQPGRVIHRAVHERGMPASLTPKLLWDRNLLTFVIETVNAELKKRGRKLPDPKYAVLIALYYELCLQTGKREVEMVQQLLKIA